jgi:dolichyl-phosphate beta-glucosyltransferase
LLVVPVTAWAAFTLARRLTGRFWASLLAGAVYGFSPFELWHSLQGQPNLTVITLFPLMAYLVLRWWEGTLSAPWYIGWLVAALAVEFYTFTEAFADLTIVGAAALAIGFLVAGRAAWRTMGKLTLHTAIAYACALVLAAPYLSYAFTHYSTALVRQRNTFSLSLVRLILPPSGRDFGLTSLVDYSNVIGRYSIDDYVGVPLLLVLVGLAVFARRSRLARLLALGFALVIALAVGPGIVVGTKTLAGLPWAGLWRLPILRSAEPSRLIIFGYLILAIALALWLAAPSKTWLRTAGRWGLGLLAVAAVFADLPTFSIAVPPEPAGVVAPAGTHPTDRLPAFFTDGLYRNYLTPGETIVIVTHRGNGGMLFQADANFYFRIAGGFINTSLTPQDAIPVPVALLTYAHRDRVLGFERYVRAANVGAIVVENAWAERWTSVFAKIGMHGTSVGGVTVYPTVFGPPPQQAAAQPSRLTSPDQRHGHPR